LKLPRKVFNMSGQLLPEIRLELNSGTFRIRTPEAVYVITVQPDGTLAQEITQVVEQEVVSEIISEDAETAKDSDASVSVGAEDDVFYKEVSVSMLGRIGELAKKLNLSLKDFSVQAAQDIDFGQSGKRLSDAMGQLEDINMMAENATMVIMDLTEKIQEDISRTKENIKVLNEIDLTRDEEVDSVYEVVEKMCGGVKTHQPLVDEIVSSQQELMESMSRLSDLVGTTEKKEEKEESCEFDLDTIFQTLYEFCTNEAVKKHLKTMRADKKACDIQLFHTAINESLKGVNIEDNFADVPIQLILSALAQSTENDKYKGFLEKLDKNLSSLFLEENLPLEIPQAKEVSKTEGEESQIPTLVSDIADRIKTNLEKLAKVKTELFDVDVDASLLKDFEDKTIIKRKDRDTIKHILDESNTHFASIMDFATKIFENLSFQDLTGQKITKIIELLSDFQSQLLVMLVAFNVQIKSKEKNKDITAEESEKLVQKEVDKVLANVMVETKDEETTNRFDQDAVNEMLDGMGF